MLPQQMLISSYHLQVQINDVSIEETLTSQSPEDDELCALIFPEAGKTTFPEMTSKDEFCGIAAFLTKNRSLDPVPSGSILTETLIEALPVLEHNNPIITFLLVFQVKKKDFSDPIIFQRIQPSDWKE